MKKMTVLLLTLALALTPVKIQADDTGDGSAALAPCVIAILVIGVGVVVIVGLHKMCKAIPNPNPPVNEPPALPPYYIGTNGVLVTNVAAWPPGHKPPLVVRMPQAVSSGSARVQVSDLSGSGWSDALRLEMQEINGAMSVVALDNAGALVCSNAFPITSDGTNRWALCNVGVMPGKEHQVVRMVSAP